MFSFQDRRGAVEVAFTDRYGGPLGEDLDLAEPTGDRVDESGAARLEEHLDAVGHALARGGHAPLLVRLRQVHGAEVHVVDRTWLQGRQPVLPVADGAVTALSGVALLVRAADCVPVLLADVARGLVGAAHAGRKGLVAGVVPATVARMRHLGAEELVGWVGPHICGRCYEVPAAMRDEVAAAVPEASAETSWHTPAVDVGAGVRAQLRAEGVEVVDAARCTREHPDLHSHRRDGAAAGRLGGLVWVRP